MTIYLRIDCCEAAVERPDTLFPDVLTEFPFICLSCLDEIEGPLDLTRVEVMSQ